MQRLDHTVKKSDGVGEAEVPRFANRINSQRRWRRVTAYILAARDYLRLNKITPNLKKIQFLGYPGTFQVVRGHVWPMLLCWTAEMENVSTVTESSV